MSTTMIILLCVFFVFYNACLKQKTTVFVQYIFETHMYKCSRTNIRIFYFLKSWSLFLGIKDLKWHKILQRGERDHSCWYLVKLFKCYLPFLYLLEYGFDFMNLLVLVCRVGSEGGGLLGWTDPKGGPRPSPLGFYGGGMHPP